MPRNLLMPGDPAPWFRAPSNINPNFDFAPSAGRYIVLSFVRPSAFPAGRALYDAFLGENVAAYRPGESSRD